MLKDERDIDTILRALSEQLEHIGSPDIEITICGGAALNATRLVTRTTRDVDILFVAPEEERENSLAFLRRAAAAVAKDFNLQENWLDEQPMNINIGELPAGLFKRAARRDYGGVLRVLYISRIDQVFLKLYASAYRDRQSVHVSDLLALKPTSGEIEAASRWAMAQDVSDEFRVVLADMLKQLGFDDVAAGI